MSEAIRQTEKLYPDLLSPKNGASTANLALKFVLKVRQFIEVIAGCDQIEDGDFENQGDKRISRGVVSLSTWLNLLPLNSSYHRLYKCTQAVTAASRVP